MKTVLLAGAGSDIAKAVATRMAQQGYRLQLAGRNLAELEHQAADLRIRYQAEVSIHYFDACQPETHAAFWQEIPSAPDVVICAFGYLGDQDKAKTDWAEAAHILSVNYLGAVSFLQQAALRMLPRKSGVLVGISSVAGDRGRGSNYYYGSAKAGFSAFLSGLRNELFSTGIRVLTVKPGFVDTRMTAHLQLPPLLTASPDEVAVAILRHLHTGNEVVYVRGIWRLIMLLIRLLPEFVFKRLRL